jgi:spore maturation protein SpmB
MYDGLRVGLLMSWRLSLVLVPAAFFVLVLDLFGLLVPLAALLDPVMALAGLPGEAALVFATGALITIYPAIGVMSSLSFTASEITVIALMILICHNLFVETAVQARVGSNPVRIVAVRVLTAIVVGIAVGRFMGLEPSVNRSLSAEFQLGFPGWSPAAAALSTWAAGTARIVVRIVIIVVLLMIGQRLLERSGVLRRVAKVFEPVVVLLGLPRSTAFLWIVGNTLGLTYGAAVILEERGRGELSLEDADLLNHHLAVSHSLFEDTFLFVALGAGVFILIVPRLMAAIGVVWLRRLTRSRTRGPLFHRHADILKEHES